MKHGGDCLPGSMGRDVCDECGEQTLDAYDDDSDFWEEERE